MKLKFLFTVCTILVYFVVSGGPFCSQVDLVDFVLKNQDQVRNFHFKNSQIGFGQFCDKNPFDWINSSYITKIEPDKIRGYLFNEIDSIYDVNYQDLYLMGVDDSHPEKLNILIGQWIFNRNESYMYLISIDSFSGEIISKFMVAELYKHPEQVIIMRSKVIDHIEVITIDKYIEAGEVFCDSIVQIYNEDFNLINKSKFVCDE